MSQRSPLRSPSVWALSLSAWFLLGLLNSGSEVIDVITGDRDAALWEPITWEMTSTMTFGLLTPFLITFALRVRFARTSSAVTIGGHVVAMVLFSFLHVGGMIGARKAIYAVAGGSYDFGNFSLEFLYELFKDVITYGMLVGLTYGFDYYRRYRQREIDASRLETSLAQVQLENLEHRMQPHFLFNTLNLISAKMREDIDAADRMITRLSDLLRLSMQRWGGREVTLSEEREMLDAYLEIMKARFEDRLQARVEIAPDAADALVPPLLLQPLVENAIKHGVSRREEGGRVEVTARRNGTRLLLEVRDDGPGTEEPAEHLLAKGLGLSTTAERLRRLYGEDQKLTFERGKPAGFVLTIAIPFRTGTPER